MRAAVLLLASIGAAAALAGCGGGSGSGTGAQPTTATTAVEPPPPTLTAPSDLAACNELETNIRLVSQLISSSVNAITQSVHPQELATRTGDTRKNLLLAANVLSTIRTPAAVTAARDRLVTGLRRFAADFGKAQRSAARNDLAAAASQLVDRAALADVTAATQTIDGACGG
jgi:hypothetical protein